MIIIKDNFYSNPDEVREYALNLNYDVNGNYPGHRSSNHYVTDDTCNGIEALVERDYGKVIEWNFYEPDSGHYGGCFQYTTCRDRSWIHHDNTTSWAGLIYLTPGAPLSAGTGIFQHKDTNLSIRSRDPKLNQKMHNDSQDLTKWELVDRIGNVFNRLVLYPGHYWHMSLDYFGSDLNSGRLFQTFFFNTEIDPYDTL